MNKYTEQVSPLACTTRKEINQENRFVATDAMDEICEDNSIGLKKKTIKKRMTHYRMMRKKITRT